MNKHKPALISTYTRAIEPCLRPVPDFPEVLDAFRIIETDRFSHAVRVDSEKPSVGYRTRGKVEAMLRQVQCERALEWILREYGGVVDVFIMVMRDDFALRCGSRVTAKGKRLYVENVRRFYSGFLNLPDWTEAANALGMELNSLGRTMEGIAGLSNEHQRTVHIRLGGLVREAWSEVSQRYELQPPAKAVVDRLEQHLGAMPAVRPLVTRLARHSVEVPAKLPSSPSDRLAEAGRALTHLDWAASGATLTRKVECFLRAARLLSDGIGKPLVHPLDWLLNIWDARLNCTKREKDYQLLVKDSAVVWDELQLYNAMFDLVAYVRSTRQQPAMTKTIIGRRANVPHDPEYRVFTWGSGQTRKLGSHRDGRGHR